jgi:hypothetical protein
MLIPPNMRSISENLQRQRPKSGMSTLGPLSCELESWLVENE